MKQLFLEKYRSILGFDEGHEVSNIVKFLDNNAHFLGLLSREDIGLIFLYDICQINELETCSIMREINNSTDLKNNNILIPWLYEFAGFEFVSRLNIYMKHHIDSEIILKLLNKNPNLVMHDIDDTLLYKLLEYKDMNDETLLNLLFSNKHDKMAGVLGKDENPFLSLLILKNVFNVNAHDIHEGNKYRDFLISKIPDMLVTKNVVQKLPIIMYIFNEKLVSSDATLSIWYNELLKINKIFFVDMLSKNFKIENTVPYTEDFFDRITTNGFNSYPLVIQDLYKDFNLKLTGNVPHIKFSSEIWDDITIMRGFKEFCMFASAMSSNPLNATEALYKASYMLQDPDEIFFVDYHSLKCLMRKIEHLISEYDQELLKSINDKIILNLQNTPDSEHEVQVQCNEEAEFLGESFQYTSMTAEYLRLIQNNNNGNDFFLYRDISALKQNNEPFRDMENQSIITHQANNIQNAIINPNTESGDDVVYMDYYN